MEMLGRITKELVLLSHDNGGVLGVVCDLLEKLVNDQDTYLPELKQFARKEPCWVKIGPVINKQVDLAMLPTLPFPNAIIQKHVGGRKVVIQKENGNVYINGKQLGLYRSIHQQQNGNTQQTELGVSVLTEVEKLPVQNATLCDFLTAHPEYVPEAWKERDGSGKPIFVCFWNSLFREPKPTAHGISRGFVRCGSWDNGHWFPGYICLGRVWLSNRLAAIFVD